MPAGGNRDDSLETSSETHTVGMEAKKSVEPQSELDRLTPTLNDILKEQVLAKAKQLSTNIPKGSRRIVVLYSDMFCPILRYHTELLSEILRVLPAILHSEGAHCCESDSTGIKASKEESPECHIVATILSLKSDLIVESALPEPFQLDLFDRKGFADIQMNDSLLSSQESLILDDTWARIQSKSLDPNYSSSGYDAMDKISQDLKDECDRLEGILEEINRTSEEESAPLELVCVLEQSETRNYSLPKGIRCKVAFVISKDREERPRSVALKTSTHWLDRLFLRFGYTQEWTNAQVIPLYVVLPDANEPTLEGQRPSASFLGVPIHLSAERPLEAQTRIMVKEGKGVEVFEPSVLSEIERTKVFEMRAIRKPDFLHLLSSRAMFSNMRIGRDPFNEIDDTDNNDGSKYRGNDEDNPFL